MVASFRWFQSSFCRDTWYNFYSQHAYSLYLDEIFNHIMVEPCIFVFVSNVDNSAIHHTQEVIDAINVTGALVVFLPPYSPDFMPCEELFSKVKHYLRENDIAWHNCQDTELMVFDSFLQVTDEDIRHYIEHAEYM